VKDDLMGEIPTFVANPLPKDTPTKGYVVLNRPYAFVQWMKQSPPPEKVMSPSTNSAFPGFYPIRSFRLKYESFDHSKNT
jgi:hypothetical protein